MAGSWQKAYDELKEYIAKNPSIEIGSNIIAIPSDVRPEFYQLFNAVLARLIKDNFPALLEEGYVLSRNWSEISRVVMDSLKLESIDVEAGTRYFLLDPSDGLRRVLIDPLFDVLKGKKDLAAFEQTAARILEGEFFKFYREGYQCWAIVSILKLLPADKLYDIPRSDFDMDPSSEEEQLYGAREEKVPDAVEVNKITFVQHHMYSFMVPKVIGHSSRLDFFAAFGRDFDFNNSRWHARSLSPEQEWYENLDIEQEFGRGDLWPDLAIYTSAHLKALVVIADYFQIARPDIIVEFREEQDWYEKEGLERVKRHANVLKPRLGSFIVCREAVPEAALKELEPKPAFQPAARGITPETAAQPVLNIRFLSVGYDITKLEPIIDSIIKAQTKSEKATSAGNPPA